jgi:hypothetical protein
MRREEPSKWTHLPVKTTRLESIGDWTIFRTVPISYGLSYKRLLTV